MGIKFITAAVIFLALIPNIIWMVLWPLCRIFGYHLPYGYFGWSAMGIASIALLLMLYGMFIGRWKVSETALEYTRNDIPAAFDGYRIVHISDIHLYTFMDHPEKLEAIVERINALKPDLVCFTGDMVSMGPDEAEACGKILKGIRACDGVASVLGNHDFFIYASRDASERKAKVDSLCSFQKETLGWNLLRNENMTISRDGTSISVVGIDNSHGKGQGFHTISSGDLGKALDGTEGFRILLSHDPSFWESDVVGHEDIALTLSGHTHAAQIKVFGWTPASWMFNQTHGRYDIGDQTIYVNAGLGCTAQMRIGADAEITLITLRGGN